MRPGQVFKAHRASLPVRPQSPGRRPRSHSGVGASDGVTQRQVQLLVDSGQGEHLFLRNCGKVAEGWWDLTALSHVVPPVHPCNEVTGKLHPCPCQYGSEAAGQAQVRGLPDQGRQQQAVSVDR